MKRTAFLLIVASLLAPAPPLAPKAHALLIIDFLNASMGTDSYVTNDDPFDNTIALQMLSGTATFAGGVSGTGNIYKSGAGHLLMTGTYSHQGSTVVRDGIMDLTGHITQTSAIGVGWDGLGGDLRVRAGATIVSGPVFIGTFTTSGTCIVTVDGPTTTWTVVPTTSPAVDPGNFRVGDQADGTLIIQNGALVAACVRSSADASRMRMASRPSRARTRGGSIRST